MKPIDTLMNAVEWEKVEGKPADDGLPYSTHVGVLDLMGAKMRCYRLNDGRAILHADDVEAFFGGALNPDSAPSGDAIASQPENPT